MIAFLYVAILFIIYLIIPIILPPTTNLSNFEVLIIVVASLVIAFYIANKFTTFIYLRFFNHKKKLK